MRNSSFLVSAANAALKVSGPSRRTLAWSAQRFSTSALPSFKSTRCPRCPAQHQDISAFTSYILPPSNRDLDPAGVDSGLFEEEASNDYEHTKTTLDELEKIGSSSKSATVQTGSQMVHPSDALADLISKGDLVRATQVLKEFNKLETILGDPKVEYLQAALECLESSDSELAKPSTALYWIRMAPSMRELRGRPLSERRLAKGLMRRCIATLATRDRNDKEARIAFRYLLNLAARRGYKDVPTAQTIRALRLSVQHKIRNGRRIILDHLQKGDYEEAFRKHDEVFGNSRRAGIDTAFLAMALLEPALLKQSFVEGEDPPASNAVVDDEQDHNAEALAVSSSHDLLRRDLKLPHTAPASIRAQLEKHDASPRRPVLTRMTLRDADLALQIAIRACEWDPDRLSRIYKLWYGLITEPCPQQESGPQGDRTRSNGNPFETNGMRRLKIGVVAEAWELTSILSSFIYAFMNQRTSSSILGITRLYRDETFMLRRDPRISQLRRLADRTCYLRLLRIFKDINRTVGLDPPPVAFWNKLLRVLGQTGPKVWESKTVTIAIAMGMLPGPRWSIGAHKTLPVARGSSTDSKLDEAEASNGDDPMPELLRQIGHPPIANSGSFHKLIRGIASTLPLHRRFQNIETDVPLEQWARGAARDIIQGEATWRKLYPEKWKPPLRHQGRHDPEELAQHDRLALERRYL